MNELLPEKMQLVIVLYAHLNLRLLMFFQYCTQAPVLSRRFRDLQPLAVELLIIWFLRNYGDEENVGIL